MTSDSRMLSAEGPMEKLWLMVNSRIRAMIYSVGSRFLSVSGAGE